MSRIWLFRFRATSLFVALSATSALPADAAERRFNLPVSVDVGSPPSPLGLAAADFDGNGRLDLAVATGAGVRVVLAAGSGSLTYGPPFSLTSTESRSVAAADFDGDGRVDLAAALTADESIGVFRGDGAGGFAPAVTRHLGAGREPSWIVAADLNHDGRLDLVTANHLGHDGSVLLGDGAMGFSFVGHFQAGFGPTNVVVADMDADGHLDLVFSFNRGAVVRYGEGTGLFGERTEASVAGWQGDRSVAVADFDGDGTLDIVAVTHDDAWLSLGTGDRTFGPPLLRPSVPSGRHVAAHDFLGDGSATIVVSGDAALVMEAREYHDAAHARLVAGVGQASSSVAGDFDRDGFADLAVADVQDGDVKILTASADGGFEATRGLMVLGGGRFELADFDGNGFADAVLGRESDFVVAFADGHGGYAETTLVDVDDWGFWRLWDLASGDVDGDGLSDLVALGHPTKVGVFPGDGAGGFLPPLLTPLDDYYERVALADWNGDAALDLLLSYATAERVTVLLGDGAGGFVASASYGVALEELPVAGDFDADGVLDWAAKVDGSAGVFFGRGDGTFEEPAMSPLPPFTRIRAAADLNGDGGDDLCVTAYTNSNTELLTLIAGPGRTFQPIALVDGFAGLFSVDAIDVDADGRNDLVAVGSSLRLYLGRGDGTFDAGSVIPVGVEAYEVRRAELDGDGRPDLAVFGYLGVCALLDRTTYLADALRGNVSAATGSTEDVLFVNGSAGTGPNRVVEIGIATPLEITLASPSYRPGGPTKFVLYKWLVEVSESTVVDSPLGLGRTAAPTPLVPAGLPQFKHCWNTIGKFTRIGTPTHPASPAPTVIQANPSGLGRPVTWLLQGFIVDRNAPNGRAATTNGIQLIVH